MKIKCNLESGHVRVGSFLIKGGESRDVSDAFGAELIKHPNIIADDEKPQPRKLKDEPKRAPKAEDDGAE